MRKKLCILLAAILCFSVFAAGCRKEKLRVGPGGAESDCFPTNQGEASEPNEGEGNPDNESTSAPEDKTDAPVYAWPATDHGVFSHLTTYDQVADVDEYEQELMAAVSAEFPEFDNYIGLVNENKDVITIKLPDQFEIKVWLEKAEDDQYQLFSYYQSDVSFDTPATEICASLDKYLGWQPDASELQQAIDELKEEGFGLKSLGKDNVFMKISTILGEDYSINIETIDAVGELSWVERRMSKA